MARLRAHILDANYKTGLKYGLVEQNNVRSYVSTKSDYVIGQIFKKGRLLSD